MTVNYILYTHPHIYSKNVLRQLAFGEKKWLELMDDMLTHQTRHHFFKKIHMFKIYFKNTNF